MNKEDSVAAASEGDDEDEDDEAEAGERKETKFEAEKAEAKVKRLLFKLPVILSELVDTLPAPPFSWRSCRRRENKAAATDAKTNVTLGVKEVLNQCRFALHSSGLLARYRRRINKQRANCLPLTGSTRLLPLLLCLILSLQFGSENIKATSNYQQQLSYSTSDNQQTRNTADVLVQTGRHGIFKGSMLLSRNASGGHFNEVVGFLGIRYASAPMKRLRFMPPTAYYYAPNQVHNMRQFGPICPQHFPLQFGYQINGFSQDQQLDLMQHIMPRQSFGQLRPLIKRLLSFEQSEDCLNLNIFAPLEAITKVIPDGRTQTATTTTTSSIQPQQRLPVLVIIHGESFDYGSGSSINALSFVQTNQLLVVTFNYRLNILGFPPKLAGASRGNLGLMDQVAALHWIKDNIGKFGGAPNNITLMGTKRAAIFVNLLMLSPLAKGLFKRAIMEDGSALTPLVANHILSAPISHHQLQLPPAMQHVRLLAKLNDCPLFSQTTQTLSTTPTPQTTTTTTLTKRSQTNISNSSQTFVNNNILPQVAPLVSTIQLSLAADESKTNALTFECLRNKPIELILQRLPLDLLHLNQQAAQVSIDARWLKWIPISSSSSEEQNSKFKLADNNNTKADLLIAVDAKQVNELITRLTRALLEHGKGSAAPSIDGQQISSLELGELEKLFSLIYSQPTSSVRPIFGPVMDGTIVPDEDIAVAMLKPGSSFAQRDLLIGLTKPNLINNADGINSYAHLLAPDHLMAPRISKLVERTGLSNEQAVEIVNVFVHSFYRYHNQEITNSIISNYLSSSSMMRRQRKVKLSLKGSRSNIVEDREEETGNKMGEHQLLVLNALLEAFHDALTNVPVLKTALIHATRQLDSLTDVFVGQQFEKWKRSELQAKQTNLQDNQLLESFILFAQALFNDPNWPLELRTSQAVNEDQIQPKATYLYQFDLSLILKQVQIAINKLSALQNHYSVAGAKHELVDISEGLVRIKRLLENLLDHFQSNEFLNQFGFHCAFVSESEKENIGAKTLAAQFKAWLCSKFSSTLADFITNGNVNNQLQADHFNYHLTLSINEKLSSVLSNCFENKQYADHHSVQPSNPLEIDLQNQNSSSKSEEEGEAPMSKCELEMNSIALDYLIKELENQTQESSSTADKWLVFSVFSQQVATLPGNYKSNQKWQLNQLTDFDNHPFDTPNSFLARTSFWSNFIPALNCSKTQPINPLSLFGSPSTTNSGSLNSTLMNINLLFSCNQNVPKTAHDVIESILNSMKQHLQAKINHYISSSEEFKQSTSENHHTLRMANMSQSNSVVELDNSDQQQPETILDEQLSSGLNSDLIKASTNSTNIGNFLNLQNRFTFLTLSIATLLISITTASVAFIVKSRLGKKRARQQESTRNKEISSDEHQHNPQINLEEPDENLKSNQVQEQQQQQLSIINEAASIQPTYANHSDGIFIESQLADDIYHQHESFNGRNHVYTVQSSDVDDTAHQQQEQMAAYCPGQAYGEGLNTVTLCRSHSSLSMSNKSTIVEKMTNNSGTAIAIEHLICPEQTSGLTSSNNGLSSNSSTNGNIRRSGCLLNSENRELHYGGSSSETQVQSSSVSSSLKKRVKISDPKYKVSTMDGRQSDRFQNFNHNLSINRNNNSQQHLYCPVHRPDNSRSSNSDLSLGYFVNDLNQLIATNQPHTVMESEIAQWNHSQVNDIYNPVLDQQQEQAINSISDQLVLFSNQPIISNPHHHHYNAKY